MPNCTDVNLLGPWAWKSMGAACWTPEGKTALGYVEDGAPKWAIIYDHYEEGGSIQMHVVVADSKYVTRQAISACFEYPFIQLGVKKVIGIVNSSNYKALAFDLRLGFKIEHVVKDAYINGDMYILSMTQDQCRWLRGFNYGFVIKGTEAA